MDDYNSNKQHLIKYIELCKRKSISDISSMINHVKNHYIINSSLISKYNDDEITTIKNVLNMYHDHENVKDIMISIYKGYYLMKGGVNKFDDEQLEKTISKYATKFSPVRNKIINIFKKYDTPENKEKLIIKIKDYLGENNVKDIEKIKTMKNEISKYVQQFFIEYIQHCRNEFYIFIKNKFVINIDNEKLLNNKAIDTIWSSEIRINKSLLEETIAKRNSDENIKWRTEDKNNNELINFINKLFKDNSCIGSGKINDVIKNFDTEFFVIFNGHIGDFLDYEIYEANKFIIDNIYQNDAFVSKLKLKLIHDFDTEWNKMITNIESIIIPINISKSNDNKIETLIASINEWINKFVSNLKNQKSKYDIVKNNIDEIFSNMKSDIEYICKHSNDAKCDIINSLNIQHQQKKKKNIKTPKCSKN